MTYWNNVDYGEYEIATAPISGFGENYQASLEAFRRTNKSSSEYMNLAQAYGDRIKQIEEVSGEKLDNPMTVSSMDNPADLMMAESPVIPTRRLKSREIGEFEDRVEELKKQYPDIMSYTDMQNRIKEQAYEAELSAFETADRSRFAGKVGALAGNMQGVMEDPITIMSLPFGPSVSSGILRTAMVEVGIAAGSEAFIQLQTQRYRDEMGLESGIGLALENIALAGLGGGIFGGGIKALSKGFSAVSGKKLVEEFDKNIKNPTIEQKTARDIVLKQAEEIEQAPYKPDDHDGIIEHGNRLEQSIRTFVRGEKTTLSEFPTNSPSKINQDNLDGVIYGFIPDDIEVDAKTFQFKEGGDAFGVTERLQGVKKWDSAKAGQVMVFENLEGKKFIADGHQRLGLAKRIKSENPNENIKIYGLLFREADGYTPQDLRVSAAMKNIAEGTGSAIDAAKVLRIAPERISELPPASSLVRQARELVNLSDEAFGVVVNEIVPANYAAIVGRIVPENRQMAVLDVLAKTDAANVTQAESIVRQAMSHGFAQETQMGLFGEEVLNVAMFAERAKVLDKTLKKLKQDRKIFDTLVSNEGSITDAGNVLSRDTNQMRAKIDAVAVDMLQRLANRQGGLSDALSDAARKAKNEGRYTGAVNDFAGAIRRAVESGDYGGDTLSRDVGDVEYKNENAGLFEQPARQTEAEGQINEQELMSFDEPASEASENQASLFERQVAGDESLNDFDVPVGETVDEMGNRVPVIRKASEILDEIKSDEADIDAMGGCLL